MDFFHLSPEDPADAWKNGEKVNGDDSIENLAHLDPAFSCQHVPNLDAPLDPHATVELFSGTGQQTALCAQINTRFAELGFLNGMVKDQCLFMTVFVSCKSCLCITRHAHPEGGYAITGHKFLATKTKEK